MDRVEEFAIRGFGSEYNDNTRDLRPLLYNNFNENNVYQHFLVSEVSYDKEFEIPIMLKDYLNCMMGDHQIGATRIVLPLWANGQEQIRVRRLVATILSDFQTTNKQTRLQGIKTSKGDRYYGGPGLILDGQYKPLLVLTVVAKYNKPAQRFEPVRCVCHIHPRVMNSQDGLLEKTIYKKFIPLYCQDQIPSAVINYMSIDDPKVSIVIDDCDQFCPVPKIPSPSRTTDAALNDLLIRHLEDIVV